MRQQRIEDKFADYNFLYKAVFADLLDRLDDLSHTFDQVGCLNLRDANCLQELRAHPKVGNVINVRPYGSILTDLVGDAEAFPLQNLDMVFSCLDLHTLNDVPGTLLQLRKALKPDGLLVAGLFGGETLSQLHHSLATAEQDVLGGVSPRVSPFGSAQDFSMLLQRAGFALPVVDAYPLTAEYDTLFDLIKDLRGMGETNAVALRSKKASPRQLFMKSAEIYQDQYGKDGRIPATFEIISFTAWAPAATQQQPLRPGSAKMRLADALQAEEKSAGEKTG